MTERRIIPTTIERIATSVGSSLEVSIFMRASISVIAAFRDPSHHIVQSSGPVADRKHPRINAGEDSCLTVTASVKPDPSAVRRRISSIWACTSGCSTRARCHLQALVHIQAASKCQMHSAGKPGNTRSSGKVLW